MNITKDEIRIIYPNISEELLDKMIFYNDSKNYKEFEEYIIKKYKNDFVEVLLMDNLKMINELDDKRLKLETESIFRTAYNLLLSVNDLIIKNKLLEAYILLRSVYENISIGIVINEDNDVYNEFRDVSVTDETRKYTKPQHIRNKFKNYIKEIDDNNLFEQISKTKLQDMFDEFYDKTSKLVHCSPFSVTMTNYLNDGCKYSILMFLLNDFSMFEIILYESLCHYSKINPSSSINYSLLVYMSMILNYKAIIESNNKKINTEYVIYSDKNNEKNIKELNNTFKEIFDLFNDKESYIQLLYELFK